MDEHPYFARETSEPRLRAVGGRWSCAPTVRALRRRGRHDARTRAPVRVIACSFRSCRPAMWPARMGYRTLAGADLDHDCVTTLCRRRPARAGGAPALGDAGERRPRKPTPARGSTRTLRFNRPASSFHPRGRSVLRRQLGPRRHEPATRLRVHDDACSRATSSRSSPRRCGPSSRRWRRTRSG